MRHTLHSAGLLLASLLVLGAPFAASAGDVVCATTLFGPDYNSGAIGSYTATWSATTGGFTVDLANFNNNNNGWTYVKCGRKNVESVATLSTAAAVPEAVTRVTLTIDKVTAAKVNSIKLFTGDSQDAATQEAGSFEVAQGEQSVSLAQPAAGKWYKVVFDCAAGSANGLVQLSKVEWLAADGGATTAASPTLTPGGVFTTVPYEVTVTNNEPGATVYYTLDGSAPGEGSDSFTGTARTLQISATTTLKAMAVADGKSASAVSQATYTYEQSIANTAETAYTVGEARQLIEAGSPQLASTEVYVRGVVSRVDSYNATYGSITYWISEDGGEDGLFEIYGGLNIGGERFLALTDLQPSDKVVVKGHLKKYVPKTGDPVYEMDKDNQLVSRETSSTKTTPALTAEYKTALAPGESDEYDLVYTGDAKLSSSSSNEDVASVGIWDGTHVMVSAEGEGTAVITISAPETAAHYAAELTYTVTVRAAAGGLETFCNGGFETWLSDTEPQAWKSSTTASSATLARSEDAHGGSYSCLVRNATSNKRLASKEFILPEGWYTMTFYAKAAGETPAQARPGYAPFDHAAGKLGTYVYGEYTPSLGQGEWTPVSYTFRLEQETQVNLVVMNPRSSADDKRGDLLVDDFELRLATQDEIDSTPVGVAGVEAAPGRSAVYTLSGLRAGAATRPGIYIVDGRKVSRR